MRREWLETDYYAVLGVAHDASEKDIKRSYRKLAQQYHPDTNSEDPQAEERFKEITEAYAVLGDAEQRRQYDQAREAMAQGMFVGGPGGGQQYVRMEDLGDLFGGLILGNAEGFTVFNADGSGSTREVDRQRVEKLQTIELGYRGQVIPNKLFIDANAYYNISEDFLSPVSHLPWSPEM